MRSSAGSRRTQFHEGQTDAVPRCSRHDLANHTVLLVQHEEPARRPFSEVQIGTCGQLATLLGVLRPDELKQSLAFSAVAKKNPTDRVLPALRQVVR